MESNHAPTPYQRVALPTELIHDIIDTSIYTHTRFVAFPTRIRIYGPLRQIFAIYTFRYRNTSLLLPLLIETP